MIELSQQMERVLSAQPRSGQPGFRQPRLRRIRVKKPAIRPDFYAFAKDPCRISGNDTSRRYGLRYHRSGSYHTTVSDLHPRQDHAAPTDEAVPSHARMQVEASCPVMSQYPSLECYVALLPNMHTNRKCAVKLCRKRKLCCWMDVHSPKLDKPKSSEPHECIAQSAKPVQSAPPRFDCNRHRWRTVVSLRAHFSLNPQIKKVFIVSSAFNVIRKVNHLQENCTCSTPTTTLAG